MTTWILVGNQSVAKLFTRETNVDAPTLIKEFEHPEGRLHRGDLVTDKGAAVFQSHGSGQQRTTTPRVSVSEQEARYFASELAEKLRLGRNEGQFQQLTLVCAPEFLGMLREAVDDATAKLITAEFTKNIADNPTHDVASALQKLS